MRRKPQCGQALLMLTVSLIAMIALLGLTVDIGWAYFRQHAAQAAADSAALAAAEAAASAGASSVACDKNGIACPQAGACLNPSPSMNPNNTQSACAYAAANGFRHAGKQTVTVTAGTGSYPPSAPKLTANYRVTVRVSERIPQLFSAVLGNNGLSASARATSALYVADFNSCIYVLDGKASGAFTAKGTTDVSAGSCEIYVNSNSGSAFVAGGSANVSAKAVEIAGGADVGGSASVTPAPSTHVADAAPDPFQYLPAPALPACKYNNLKINKDTTLKADGAYCGGIQISSNAKVTFEKGTYVIDGGALTVSGSNATLTGTAVTFYLTNRSGSYDGVSISGGNITLTAPTSGQYQGILFFQERKVVGGATSSFAGGSSMQLTGSLYFPTTGLKYAGGSSETYTAIVAATVEFTGNSFLRPDVTGVRTGLARRNIGLVE